MARWLAVRGMEVTVLDNLSGHREAVQWGDLIVANLMEPLSLEHALVNREFDAVMHFCARSFVDESVNQPYLYYANNVVGTLNLLEAMERYGIGQLIFSSTASVYGQGNSALINEDHPKTPISPYGTSKLMVEQILADAAVAYGLRSVSLRYFNAAGASADSNIGESHEPETHLIPNVLRAALEGGSKLKIFGSDYPTPDGTCIRDFVHVDDLAHAHELTLDFLETNEGVHVFNLGNGKGFSVRQVIEVAQEVTGKSIGYEIAPRREGDPAILVASSEKAENILGWKPAHTELASIIQSAWDWHRAQKF
jgi:UDP-glucose 4-epimerase